MTRPLALAALLASSCGPTGGVWVTVEAPLRAPDQCDSVRVQAWIGEPDGGSVFDQAYAIRSGAQFPQTLAVTTRDSADFEPQTVSLVATALLQGKPVGTSPAQKVLLEKGRLVPATLEIAPATP